MYIYIHIYIYIYIYICSYINKTDYYIQTYMYKVCRQTSELKQAIVHIYREREWLA